MCVSVIQTPVWLTFDQTYVSWDAEFQTEILPDKWKEICTIALQIEGCISIRSEFQKWWQKSAQVIYWKNVIHKLGLICTYPASVQEALEKIFHQNLARESKVALIRLIPAGSERSAGKYLLQLLLTAAINALWLGRNMMLLHILCCWIWSGRSLKASERFIHQELETCFYNILNIKERILEICVLDGGMTFYFILF